MCNISPFDDTIITPMNDIIIAIIFSTTIFKKIESKLNNKNLFIIVDIVYVLLFIITISYLVSDSYNPFLYFRF